MPYVISPTCLRSRRVAKDTPSEGSTRFFTLLLFAIHLFNIPVSGDIPCRKSQTPQAYSGMEKPKWIEPKGTLLLSSCSTLTILRVASDRTLKKACVTTILLLSGGVKRSSNEIHRRRPFSSPSRASPLSSATRSKNPRKLRLSRSLAC